MEALYSGQLSNANLQAPDTEENTPIKKKEPIISSENHSSEGSEEKDNENPHSLLVCAADVQYEPPQWAAKPYIQKGKLNLVQGEPGVGKTIVVCAFGAHVTTGEPIRTADGEILIDSPGNVLMLSVEDDMALLRGRFEASHGDITKLHFLSDAYDFSLADTEDLEKLEKIIKSIDAKMVVFDPLQAFLGEKTDMHRANQTRPIMAKLSEIAKRCDCAIVIIAHTSKGSKENAPVLRSLGSVDIPASCRSILHVEKPDPESDEIAVYHIKSNSAPKGKTLIYTIGDRGGVNWQRFTDETLYQVEQSGQDSSIRDECKDLILQSLKDGDIKSTELDRFLCEKNGFSVSTKDRAKRDLHKEQKIRYYIKTENDSRETYVTLTGETQN